MEYDMQLYAILGHWIIHSDVGKPYVQDHQNAQDF